MFHVKHWRPEGREAGCLHSRAVWIEAWIYLAVASLRDATADVGSASGAPSFARGRDMSVRMPAPGDHGAVAFCSILLIPESLLHGHARIGVQAPSAIVCSRCRVTCREWREAKTVRLIDCSSSLDR